MAYVLNVVCNVLELESVEMYFYTPGFHCVGCNLRICMITYNIFSFANQETKNKWENAKAI